MGMKQLCAAILHIIAVICAASGAIASAAAGDSFSMDSPTGYETRVVCDDQRDTIGCPAGTGLVIHSAFFGRTSDKYCASGPRLTYDCSSSIVFPALSERCNGKATCEIYSRLLADPCPGTFKYMIVGYTCKALQTKVVCDGSRDTIACPDRTKIVINSVFYGRYSDQYCAFGPRLTYTCSSPLAMPRVSDWCNGKQSCLIPAATMRDPCVGTVKYLHVTYSCQVVETLTICDGQKGAIACDANSAIQIEGAIFGRLSDQYCASGPRPGYDCSSDRVFPGLSDLCNGRSSCEVSSTLFPDPCYGTFKYMHVTYSCKDFSSQVTACDGGTLKVSCPSETNIDIVSGFYGRDGAEICPNGPQHTTSCGGDQTAKVKFLCDYSYHCSFHVGGGQFGGDPCPGTYKYAAVKYKCTKRPV